MILLSTNQQTKRLLVTHSNSVCGPVLTVPSTYQVKIEFQIINEQIEYDTTQPAPIVNYGAS